MEENTNLKINSENKDPDNTDNFPIWILIPIFILNVSSIWYTLKSRTPNDIKYPLYISIVILITIVFFIIIKWTIQRFKKIDTIEIKFLIASPFASLLIGFSYYCIGVSVLDLFQWLPTAFKSEVVLTTIIILLTLITGLIFFFFRLRFRATYGFIEILTGLAVAVNRVFPLNNKSYDNEFYLAFITAAVYLVVRGLDNIHQGISKEPFDPIITKVKQKFKK